MKCPSCGRPLTLPELMKIAVWAEYKCPNCHKVSQRPKQNQMLSILVIVAIPFMDRLLHGIPFWISTAIIALVVLRLMQQVQPLRLE